MITFNFKKDGESSIELKLPQHQQTLFDHYNWTRQNYNTIVKYSVNNSSEKIYLGEKNKCRFCGKDYKAEEFKTIAHSISEFFGNKKIFSNDECDSCNSLFGTTIENELSKFLSPFLSIGFIKGKKQKSIQINDETKKINTRNYPFKGKLESSVITNYTDRLLSFSTKNPNESMIEELDNNKLKLNFLNLEIDHHKIMKAISKIALSIMPENELTNFEHTIKWIFEKGNNLDVYPVNSYGLFIIMQETVNKNNKLEIVLLKKKDYLDDSYPYMFVGIFFAQFSFFCPVQFSKFDNMKREDIKFCASKINTASIMFENFLVTSLRDEAEKVKLNLNFNMTYHTKEEN